MTTALHRDNHYVPRSYIKRWSHDGAKVWTYRVLVSHANIPTWKAVSLRGVAYHEHLYTRIAASEESDEIERWLDSDFESPAEHVVAKVVGDKSLSRGDWRVLIRFFAAQDVRTPARLMENLTRWSETLPDAIQTTLNESIAKLGAMTPAERAAIKDETPTASTLPLRVSVQKNEERGGGWIKAETVAGRGLWLWSMQHALQNTVKALLQHRWTILEAPRGLAWLTTDDPAIKLNFNGENDYTFGGGWGSVGTDLLLPLSPRHLLFTQVGKPVPRRGTMMDPEKARLLQRLIAQHAHRYIFAAAPDKSVEASRPRIVNPAELKREAKEWVKWHAEQSRAERELLEG